MKHPRQPGGPWDELGDFTTTKRTILITGLAIGIGIVACFVALTLLELISGFTNLFFFARVSIDDAQPVDATLGVFVILIPVIGR